MIGVVAIILIQIQVEEMHKKEIQYSLRLESSIEVASYAKRAEGHLMLYLIVEDEVDLQKFFDRHASLDEKIQNLRNTAITQNDFVLLEELQSKSDDVLMYGNMILEHTKHHDKIDFEDKVHEDMLLNFHDATSSTRKISLEFTKRLDVIAIDIASYAKRAEGHLMLYLVLHDEIDKKKFNDRMASMKNSIDNINKLSDPAMLSEIERLHTAFSDTGKKLIEIHDKDPLTFLDNVDNEMLLSINKYASSIRSKSIDIVKDEVLDIKKLLIENTSKSVFSQQIILFSIMATTILAVIISTRMASSITKSILQLKDATQKVSNGNLNTSVNLKTNDEIQLVGEAFNKMTNALKEAKSTIETSEKKYRGLYETSPESIHLTDKNGVITDCNNAFATMVGLSEKELVGQPIFNFIPESEKAKVQEIFEQFINKGYISNAEVFVITNNGKTVPVLVSGSVLHDADNNVIGTQIIVKDMSEIENRKRLEESHKKRLEESHRIIKNQLEDLKQMDIQKEEFATIASHELRTPLTPITGYIEILLNPEMSNVGGEDLKILKKIYRNTKKLEILINRIFLAQKLDKGEVKVYNTEFSLKELTDNVHKAYSSLMKKKNITFLDATKDGIIINSDSDRIQDIFSNLIQNTLDFVPEYGRIEIGAKIQNSDILYWVKDNGFGIPKEKQDKLFHKFYQVDSSLRRKHEGIGLGLTICKGLVETMGGKIWVDSDEDKGATFYFTIPKSERLKKEMNE